MSVTRFSLVGYYRDHISTILLDGVSLLFGSVLISLIKFIYHSVSAHLFHAAYPQFLPHLR